MAKKRRVKKRRKTLKKIDKAIEIDQILLENRQLFLFDEIDCKLANQINRELFALDKINNKPIVLRINSPGGSLASGYSIIDTMKIIRSPVITIVSGYACSMAGLISVSGDQRVMTKNAIWMAHDMSSYNEDYATKMIDYTDFLKKQQKKLFEFLGKYTKLSQAELTQARNGELWFFAKDAKKKGICDIIVE